MDTKEINIEELVEFLPKRYAKSHKGTFGHVAIVGGSKDYIKAGSLATEAAVRTGSGLITWINPKGIGIYPPLSSMILPIGNTGHFVKSDAFSVIKYLDKIDAYAIGSGLGNRIDTFNFIIEVLSKINKPAVIDADGLNAISYYKAYDLLNDNHIITPHVGEMARLLDYEISDVINNPLSALKNALNKFKCCIVLKGSRTYVGYKSQNITYCDLGNPGMASGGSGDVLSGIIASL